MASQLELGGMTVAEVYDQITKQGIPATEAATLVSAWIFENFGRSKRTFNYQQAFPETHPECVSKFSRTFTHTDWVDGESIVQAGETVGELGFNWRFHRIEEDLDAVRADLVQAFECLAEMRRSLRVLLDELRAEINRINTDIHECCHRDGRGSVVEVFPNFGGLVDQARYLGPGKFDDRTVSMWQTQHGIMMLPAVQTIGVEVITGPRAQKAGKLARYIEENPLVRRAFPETVAKQDFLERFGNERTEEGLFVRELVEMLPDTKFPNLAEMVEGVAEREAAALRTTAGASAAVAAAFDLQTDVDRVADASLDRLSSIPAKTRAVLMRHGVDTVAALAKADPREITALLEQEGVRASTGEAAEWRGMASTLMRVR